MTDYRGTPANDLIDNRTLNLGPGDNIYGEAGDDRLISVTLTNLVGGQGNDTLEGGGLAMAVYWPATSPVTLDLEAGYADDGQGGRDVLVGIKGAHGSDQDDRFYGDRNNNVFWPNGGTNYVDGRGGEDLVILTSDPSQTTLTKTAAGYWTYFSPTGRGELHNVELLQYYFGSTFSPIYSLAGAAAEVFTPKVVKAGDPQAIGSSYSEIATDFFKVTQFGFGAYSIEEAHPAFFYPKVTDTHAAGSFTLDAHNMVTGDFNGDGFEDLAVIWVAFPHTVYRETPVYPQIFLNRGDGTLGPANDIISGPLPNRHMNYRTYAADFNGDGRDDLVIASMSQGSQNNPTSNADLREPITLLLSTPSGKMVDASKNIQGQEQGGVPEGYSFGHDMSVGDVDGDGDIDFYTNKVLMLNDGQGHFTLATAKMPEEARNFSYVMSSGMGDLDGDGIDDLIVAYAEGYGRFAFLSNGKGIEGARVIRLPEGPYGLANTKSNYLSVGDLTGDGRPDILIACTRADPYYQGQYLQLLVNRGDGVFVEEVGRVNNAAFDTYHGEGELYLRDMNGDGSIDIVHATGKTSSDTGFVAGGIHIFLNNGRGYFSAVEASSYAYVNPNQLEGWGHTGQGAINVAPRMAPIQLTPGAGVDLIGSVMTPNYSETLPNISQVTLFVSESIKPLGRGVDESLIGGANDDVFWGLDGNDNIDGGAGIDRSIYAGVRANYTISALANGSYSVTDNFGTDGTDVLTRIELLVFSDQSLRISDASAPTVLTFSPIDGAVGVAVGSNIVLTFSEAIVRGTGRIILGTSSTDGLTATIVESFDVATSSRLSLAGSILTINPTSDLLSGTRYFVTMAPATFKDITGNAYEGIATYDFITADLVPPAVLSISYGANDGKLSLGETVTLKVTLSEAVNITGTPIIVLANGGSATYTGGTGTNALTFSYTAAAGQATADLATAATNALTGTIKDLAGNAITAAGFNNVNPTGTLVVDVTAPTVSTFAPTDGATGVLLDANIVVTFSEAIALGTGTITLRSGSATGTIVESFDVATSGRLTLSGSTLNIDPTSNLSANTQYFVVFTSGNIKDAAGNSYAGISTYDFKTIADNVAPGFTSAATSADGLKVILTYNEALNAKTAAKTSFAVKVAAVGATVSSTATVNSVAVKGSTIELTLASALAQGQAVTVGYTAPMANAASSNAAVQDIAGNDAATLVATTAVTNNSTVDKTAPTVSTFAPTDGATGVLPDANIVVTFSEAIARGTGTITLRSVSATGTIVESFDAATSNRLTLSGSTLTIDPTSDLAANTQYFVVLTSGNIKDAAGNAYAGISTYDFKTASIFNGTANNDTLTGTIAADTINGLAGNDVITGGAGKDIMNGGDGSDLYIIAAASEHAAAEIADSGASGLDEVRFTSAIANATLTLFAGDTGIEQAVIGTGTASAAVTTATTALNINAAALSYGLALIGNAGTNTLTGGSGADSLQGGAGNDTLIGGAGADQLRGGIGLDTLTGGADIDWFIFDTAPSATTNRDTITDFVSGTDKLQFSKAVFTGLSSAALGNLTTDAFWSGAGVSTAHDATDRFIYNTTTGALFYDADGNAAGSAAVQVALLGATTHPTLSFADIQIIG